MIYLAIFMILTTCPLFIVNFMGFLRFSTYFFIIGYTLLNIIFWESIERNCSAIQTPSYREQREHGSRDSATNHLFQPLRALSSRIMLDYYVYMLICWTSAIQEVCWTGAIQEVCQITQITVKYVHIYLLTSVQHTNLSSSVQHTNLLSSVQHISLVKLNPTSPCALCVLCGLLFNISQGVGAIGSRWSRAPGTPDTPDY